MSVSVTSRGCSYLNCSNPHRGIGLCATHYQAHRRRELRAGVRQRPEALSRREAVVLEHLRAQPGPAFTREIQAGVVDAHGWRIGVQNLAVTADFLAARGLVTRLPVLKGHPRQWAVNNAGRAFPQARIDEALA